VGLRENYAAVSVDEFVHEEAGYGFCLNIGSGSNPITSPSDKLSIINLDISKQRSLRVNVIGDVHHLPFKNNVFSSVIFNGVVEHIRHPYRALAEIHKVLQEAGLVYVGWPFLQEGHSDPYDYTRYTLDGMNTLMSDAGFSRCKHGVAVGPLSEIASLLFSFIKGLVDCFSITKWYLIRKLVVGGTYILLTPFKLIDKWLIAKSRESQEFESFLERVACAFWGIYRKN
jgi:SAM-dependent methyltransferase